MANPKPAISPYVQAPESRQLRDQIEAYYAGIIPDLRMAFAEYVFKKGEGALAPTKGKDGQQESWQAVGRRLYGPKFMDDLRAVVAKNRVVSDQ